KTALRLFTAKPGRQIPVLISGTDKEILPDVSHEFSEEKLSLLLYQNRNAGLSGNTSDPKKFVVRPSLSYCNSGLVFVFVEIQLGCGNDPSRTVARKCSRSTDHRWRRVLIVFLQLEYVCCAQNHSRAKRRTIDRDRSEHP